jgi:hypothetical protein
MDINLLLRGDNLNRVLGRLLPGDRLVRELLSSLRPGQTLQAQVLNAPRAGLAQLLIQDIPLSARTERPLTPGQTLTLTVLETGDTPQLRVQDPQRPPTGQDVLRLALPRQLPLTDSLTGLSQLAARVLPLLPGNAREALLTLLERHVPLRQISSSAVRQAVTESGLFTEARLASGQQPLQGDRKILLLRLATALGARTTPLTTGATGQAAAPLTSPTDLETFVPLSRAHLLAQRPGDAHQAMGSPAQASAQAAGMTAEQQALDRLLRLVDASLARIQTHQAASLASDDPGQKVWQLEIPVTVPGQPPQAVELHIEPEDNNGAEEAEEAGWLVTVGFVFAQLGPVKAGVRLAGGRVSTTFWCERAAAVQRFEQHLPQLQTALEAAGLEVGHLAASQGQPPKRVQAHAGQNLLDERV